MIQQAVKNTKGVAIEDATVMELDARLTGHLLRHGDDGYEDARKIWNAMIDKRPAIIARCMGTADVIDAVNFAREHGLRVSVKGGGHNIAGTSLCDDGMVIDLSLMKGMRVDLDSRTVRAQPGCTLGDLDRETQRFGYAVPAGIISETGIAGLTLGGGFGWLTRKYGYASDNLLSVDIVTADGSFLKASESENADLFWGVRGGGGNFGIVTSFEYRMHPVGPTVIGGMVLHPMEKAPELIQFYKEFTESAPDELTSLLILRIAPPAPFLPKEVHGAPVAGIAVCYAGPVEDGAKAVEPLKKLGTPLADLVGPKPFTAIQKMLDSGQPKGRHYYWKSEYMHEVSKDAGNTMMRHTEEFPSPESSVLVMQLGGAMGRVGENEMAVGHRDAEYLINIAGSCTDPDRTERVVSWARGLWSDMLPYSTGGVYVNFLTQDEGQDRVRAAYGAEKYEQLVKLKNKYDSTNFFSLNQNIKPTV